MASSAELDHGGAEVAVGGFLDIPTSSQWKAIIKNRLSSSNSNSSSSARSGTPANGVVPVEAHVEAIAAGPVTAATPAVSTTEDLRPHPY